MNTTRIRRTLATLGLMLGTVAAPAEAVPVFQIHEQAFGSPGCLPETSPHLSIRCNPAILRPDFTTAIGNFDVDARAEGQIGATGLELGMFARLSAISPFLPLFPGPGFLTPFIEAQVRFFDLVTLTAAGVAQGAPISPVVTLSVTGVTCQFCGDGPPVVVGPNYATPQMRGTVSMGLPETDEFTTTSFEGPANVVAQVDVFNGVPFSLAIFAGASISVDVDSARLAAPDFFHWESHATADFSHTVRITDIRLPDAPDVDLTLTSSDGRPLLSPAAAAVPEPSTAWLVGTVLVAWAVAAGSRGAARLRCAAERGGLGGRVSRPPCHSIFVSVSRSARISRLCQS
jgi:hypothetical protein